MAAFNKNPNGDFIVILGYIIGASARVQLCFWQECLLGQRLCLQLWLRAPVRESASVSSLLAGPRV